MDLYTGELRFHYPSITLTDKPLATPASTIETCSGEEQFEILQKNIVTLEPNMAS